MVVYNDIYIGDDGSIAEQSNFISILSSLMAAKENNESFVLMSSSIVFDRSVEGIYSESDAPDATDVVAKYLIEAEKNVLSYNKGYVFRVQDCLSDLEYELIALASCKTTPSFTNTHLWLLSEEALDFLVGYYKVFAYNRNLVHLCSPDPLELSLVWLYLRGGEICDISDNPLDSSLRGHAGCLCSEILCSEDFYEDFVTRNKNRVIKKLTSIAERAEVDETGQEKEQEENV